jgi:hypothetical protein
MLLVARRSLGTDEAAQVGELIRADISAPFTFLESIFDDVINSASPNETFEASPDKYSLSLLEQQRHGLISLLTKLVTSTDDAKSQVTGK